MRAINDYKVTCFGQIPSLYVMEWRLPDYAKYDIKSLRFAIYGGQGVSKKFLERLAAMAPSYGTGLGLTEISGSESGPARSARCSRFLCLTDGSP